jgi:hypothetical protein
MIMAMCNGADTVSNVLKKAGYLDHGIPCFSTYRSDPAYGHRRLVHIQSDVCDIVHSARPPCMRLCAGHPAQPSALCMPSGGPPITQRTSGLGSVRQRRIRDIGRQLPSHRPLNRSAGHGGGPPLLSLRRNPWLATDQSICASRARGIGCAKNCTIMLQASWRAGPLRGCAACWASAVR